MSIDYSQKFLTMLKILRPAWELTYEQEQEERLPFLDNWVMCNLPVNKQIGFSTTIYRKPMFTAQYTRWDAFPLRQQKINLVKFLANQGKSFVPHTNWRTDWIKSVTTRKNGYPTKIVNWGSNNTPNPQSCAIGSILCLVYLKLQVAWYRGQALEDLSLLRSKSTRR